MLVRAASIRAALLSAALVGSVASLADGAASGQPAGAQPAGAPGAAGGIDRHALVTRHNPVLRRLDPEAPLSVGNGGFAFTADVTGLQSFPDAYDSTIPLGTLSNWGWHTAPNPNGWTIERFHHAEYDSHGRQVGYADIPGDSRTPEIRWLRANPHRLHLGRLGFVFTTTDGQPAGADRLRDVEQTLDLWTGTLRSRFTVDNVAVEVVTVCHPTRDLVAVRVVSRLLTAERLAVRVRFPYGTGDTPAADWTRPDRHATRLEIEGDHAARFARSLDADAYQVAARWAPAGAVSQAALHDYRIVPARTAERFDFVAEFSPGAPSPGVPSFDDTQAAAAAYWSGFWKTGAAIDLSGSSDPRWRELERRVVLSQYLTAIQGAGNLPPQETGLTFNSWEGKFHLEMHWWHSAHFALWNRAPLLEKSLGYYESIRPRARATAARQGYRGARWPKMTDPHGAESPSSVGPFLVWQQPHPIFYAELVYRERASREVLDRFKDVVFDTAEFMASFPTAQPGSQTLDLGPPLQCAQERFPKATTRNCTFELAYWRWGLEAAQRWRERLGLPREASWDGVLQRLARLPTGDGKYLFAGTAPDSFTDARWVTDHPTVLASYGLLPGPGVDRDVLRATFDWIWTHWDWPDTWGWDYPMLAMTAARLGVPDRAIDALLMDTPKNVYRANGHNHQRPGLTIYLPGNGGLLYAIAMMAGGWDGAPPGETPGFPRDGRWRVRAEGFRRAP
jgi:hypothetical protein